MTEIIYEDISAGAKEALSPSASEESSISNISQLEQSGLTFPNYANPIEKYAVVLDGASSPLPSDENVLIGYWSEQISNEDGVFVKPIILRFYQKQEEKISFISKGISIYFNSYNNIHPKSMIVRWLFGDEIIKTIEVDVDNAFYIYRENESGVVFDEIQVEFNNLNMPYNRLQVNTVIYGEYIEIKSDKLKNVNITQNLSPLSTEIPIDTSNIVIEDDSGKIYGFQERQPLSIFTDNSFQGTVYVKKARRTSKTVWNVDAENVVGILENITFYGDIYVDVSLNDFCAQLFDNTGLIYMISDELKEEKINGYLPITTARNALMQALFSVGANISTVNGDKSIAGLRPDIYIYKTDYQEIQEIPEERVMQGQTLEDENAVTAVSVTAHSLIPIDEDVVLYDTTNNEMGEGIFVGFSDPVYDLSITNGVINSFSANYAIIDARENCVLKGKKYEKRESVKSKSYNLPKSVKENVKSVTGATLVNLNNVDKVLDLCYNHYRNNRKMTTKIIEGVNVTGGELIKYGSGILYGEHYKYRGRTAQVITYDAETKVGQILKLPSEMFGTEVIGIVTKQSYNLNGNIKIKNSELKIV